jgi:hypothetical protein
MVYRSRNDSRWLPEDPSRTVSSDRAWGNSADLLRSELLSVIERSLNSQELDVFVSQFAFFISPNGAAPPTAASGVYHS